MAAVRSTLFISSRYRLSAICSTADAGWLSWRATRRRQRRCAPFNRMICLIAPTRRVLGVIRPTVEVLGQLTHTGNIGVLGTAGTIQSGSYPMEIAKMYPDYHTYGQACPMWVPLVEYREADGDGADYFVKKYVDMLFAQQPAIDTVVLGCTHYPLLYQKIKRYIPEGVSIVKQGTIVADSLKDYLSRHPEMESRCAKGGGCEYRTTESSEKFSTMASVFLSDNIEAKHITF